jgi:hypothetical protein
VVDARVADVLEVQIADGARRLPLVHRAALVGAQQSLYFR